MCTEQSAGGCLMKCSMRACLGVIYGLLVCAECIRFDFGAKTNRVPKRVARSKNERAATRAPTTLLRERVANRLQRHRERNTARVCYDQVGCFEVPRSRSPFQKMPESPENLGTKFYLFKRDIKFSDPQVIYYNDNGTSLEKSKFNFKQPLKVYIHGYLSNWNQKIAYVAADGYLKLKDCNFIVMDWSVGARGPQYTTAAANTELVGRQLGLLLMQMFEKGLDPNNVHLIGFSLGAHVAGCAAELLKLRGKVLDRITGLDPAGPLFRNGHLREKSKKLDRSDARLVDVLHTDSSPAFTDGLGLFEAIGHVDFYANGGGEQPGCTDPQASVVRSALERTLSIDAACSHIRAPQLFFENVAAGGCEFAAYQCPGGLPSFESGQCFTRAGGDAWEEHTVGRMGAEVRGQGVMYFVTRRKAPYCGTQLQSLVTVAASSPTTKGVLLLVIKHGNATTSFNLKCDISSSTQATLVYALAAAEYKSIDYNTKSVAAYLTYYVYENPEENNSQEPYASSIIINKVQIRDMFSNSWYFCENNLNITKNVNQPKLLKLKKQKC